MSRESKANKELAAQAASEGHVRGEGDQRYAILPRWVSPRDGKMAATQLLGAPSEFSHLALGYWPVYRLKGK